MIAQPSEFPIFILLLILLALFTFFATMLIVLISMYDRKKKEEEHARDQAYKKAVVILEEAKNKSLNIIKESNERARRMIKETDLAVDESKEYVHDQLKSAAEAFKTDVIKEVKDYGSELHKEALETEKEFKDKIAQEYQKVQVELDNYKKDRMKEIDKRSLLVIEEVVKEYFASTMTPQDHLDFIRQILEKHKKPFELTD